MFFVLVFFSQTWIWLLFFQIDELVFELQRK